MREFIRNQLKTFFGLLVGIPIVGILRPLNDFWFATVQCIFFALFYTLLDKIIIYIERRMQNGNRVSEE